MADKEGFADWKWLVDFHARVLGEREGERREDQREKVDQSETLDRRRPKQIFYCRRRRGIDRRASRCELGARSIHDIPSRGSSNIVVT